MKIIISLQRGFTVLEVVIAFAMLSIVTVVSVSIVTQNTMRTHKFEKQLLAMEVAETALAEINGKIVLENLESNIKYHGNSEKGYRWNAVVNKYQTYASASDSSIVLPLWKIEVQVFHEGQKQALVSLTTILPGK